MIYIRKDSRLFLLSILHYPLSVFCCLIVQIYKVEIYFFDIQRVCVEKCLFSAP